MTIKWVHRTEINSFPAEDGWYRVMVSGDSESIGEHTIYIYDDYETWARFKRDEDGNGSFVGEHDEDEHMIFAYCGPFYIPEYKADES